MALRLVRLDHLLTITVEVVIGIFVGLIIAVGVIITSGVVIDIVSGSIGIVVNDIGVTIIR